MNVTVWFICYVSSTTFTVTNYGCKHNIGKVLERGVMLPDLSMVSITANRLYRVQLRIVLGSSASKLCDNYYKFSAVLWKVCDMVMQHFTLECISVCWLSCHTAKSPFCYLPQKVQWASPTLCIRYRILLTMNFKLEIKNNLLTVCFILIQYSFL